MLYFSRIFQTFLLYLLDIDKKRKIMSNKLRKKRRKNKRTGLDEVILYGFFAPILDFILNTLFPTPRGQGPVFDISGDGYERMDEWGKNKVAMIWAILGFCLNAVCAWGMDYSQNLAEAIADGQRVRTNIIYWMIGAQAITALLLLIVIYKKAKYKKGDKTFKLSHFLWRLIVGKMRLPSRPRIDGYTTSHVLFSTACICVILFFFVYTISDPIPQKGLNIFGTIILLLYVFSFFMRIYYVKFENDYLVYRNIFGIIKTYKYEDLTYEDGHFFGIKVYDIHTNKCVLRSFFDFFKRGVNLRSIMRQKNVPNRCKDKK